ncbi:MAG TPA: hypothetical protein VMV23_06235 [Candidatus Nanopelagicaceae bacterium]|nr:hypothetical protein [Candidatus Nanopelagicaceae bacterium]
MTNPEPRVDLERMRQVYETTREQTRSAPTITQRAVARIDRDLHMEGRVGNFKLESDEPPEGGGEGRAPRPLQYLLAGAAF